MTQSSVEVAWTVEALDDDAELLDDGLSGGFPGLHVHDGVPAFQSVVVVHGDLDPVSGNRQVAPVALGGGGLELVVRGGDLDGAGSADGLEVDVGTGGHVDGRSHVQLIPLVFLAGYEGGRNRVEGKYG